MGKLIHDKDSSMHWEETKRILQEKFELLTDHKLFSKDGNYEEMIKYLQKKYGKTKKELLKILSEA